MKPILIASITLLVALVAPHALADGFTPLVTNGIPGLTDPTTAGSVINSASLAIFFNNLYKYLIGIAAALAIVEIIWSGIKIATNQDNVSTMLDYRGRIMQAIFGLVLVLAPVLVFSVINPSILDLSLNLPALNKLDTTGGGATTTATAEPGVTYTSPAQIPAGMHCYAQSTGGETAPRYVCFSSGASCTAKAKPDPSALNGECPAYPIQQSF